MKKTAISVLLVLSFLLLSFPLTLIASAEEEVGNYPNVESVSTFATLNGAAVRMNEQDETVLSFRGAINKTYLQSLKESNPGKTLTFGVIVIRKSTMELEGLAPQPSEVLNCNYIEWYANEVYEEQLESFGSGYVFYGTSGKIDYSNMYEEYIGLAYIRITASNGAALILNSAYSETNNVRRAYDVAAAALADSNASYETRFKNNMTSYLEKVLLLEKEGTKIVSKNSKFAVSTGTSLSYVSIQGDSLTSSSNLSVYYDGERYYEDNLPKVETTKSEGSIILSITPQETTTAKTTSISLLPTKVATWADFKKDLTLNASLSNTTYTKTDLKYRSTNPEVVTVDGNGSITPHSAGFAKIYAISPDGSKTSVDVEITDAIERAEDQQLTLGSTSKNRISIAKYWNWPAPANGVSFGQVNIALWKGNAIGACSITIDDSIVSEFSAWNAATKSSGIPVTFIVPGSLYTQSSHANGWKAAIAAGNDVQTHSYAASSSSIYDTWTTAQVWMDYYNGIKATESVTGVAVNVIGYSYGWSNQTLASEIFIAGRGVNGLPNQAASINYIATNSLSCSNGSNKIRSFASFQNELNAITTTTASVYNVNYYGGFLSYHWHNVNTACITDKKPDGSSFTSASEYLNYLLNNVLSPYKESGQVWFATFKDAMMYAQERDTATVKVEYISDNQDEIQFSLTDKMDDTIYKYPLTIKVRVDETWKSAFAYQDGEEMSCEIVTVEDGNRAGTYVVFEMVPDAGQLTLLKG